MSDFRLRVFQAVGQHLSLTKAAQALFITQPAVTRHVHELEKSYGQRLLARRGNRISLTDAGRLLLGHAEAVAAAELQLSEQLLALREPTAAAGRLRLGASTTICQYVLPGLLPAFQARYPRVQLTLRNANSERVAEALLGGELDLGFVEGRSRSRDLHHELLLPDELVAVRRARPAQAPDQPLNQAPDQAAPSGPRPPASPPPAPLSLAEALACPLVLRERGSGTLEVLEFALRALGVPLSRLQVAFYFDNTEAIKAYLEAAPAALGFVSRRALSRELAAGRLEIVPIAGLRLPRQFEAVWVQGQPLGRPAQHFLSFSQQQLQQL